MALDTIRTLLNNQINRKWLHLQACQQGLQQSQHKPLTMLLTSHWITLFCQQRKNLNAASSNKGICRNPITGLWEENSLAAGKKKGGGNGSCASNNSQVFSQTQRNLRTVEPYGSNQGWWSSIRRTQGKSVSGSRINSINKFAKFSFVGHIQFLPKPSRRLTFKGQNLYLPWENRQGSIWRHFIGKMSIQKGVGHFPNIGGKMMKTCFLFKCHWHPVTFEQKVLVSEFVCGDF